MIWEEWSVSEEQKGDELKRLSNKTLWTVYFVRTSSATKCVFDGNMYRKVDVVQLIDVTVKMLSLNLHFQKNSVYVCLLICWKLFVVC